MKILVTPTSFSKDKPSEAGRLLGEFADEIVYNPFGRPLAPEEILPLLEGADGYIAGLDHITAEVIQKAPSSLKAISRYGVGYERVDTEAAAAKGIIVTNTPGVNSESVADLAFGLMISAARKIPALDRKVKGGEWPRTTGVELFGKTIGIVGLGAIGRGVAMRAKGFSMNVIAHDPFMDGEYAKKHGIRECGLEELFADSDFISLHLPLNEQTRNLIDRKAFDLMKAGTVLVNTSRGGLIDEQAAYEALKSGKLGGLGLDAFENEPPGKSSLFEFENVVATPHAGAHTVEAVRNMGVLAVRNLIDVLSGRDCPNIVNKNRVKG